MADPELPSYGDVGGRSEYSCCLESKGHKWLSLFVPSRAINSISLPSFDEGDVISGRVELDLEKAEAVKGIVISVEAGTTAVGQEETKFLEMKETLWTPTAEGGKTSSKLHGRHSWPFEFTLPREVAVAAVIGQEKKMYRLPPNFSERASPAYLDYRLIVTVKRGTFKVNQTLSVNFAYLPKIVPDPPSTMRQQAYEESSSIPGPDADPEGWKVLPTIKVRGTLFEVQKFEVECTLAIATPLCYAIGSPLPLSLTLKSENEQALDLLSAASAIRLHLVRSMAIGTDATEESEARRTNNFFLSGVGQGVFWVSGSRKPQLGQRTLDGEIDLPNSLKPSFVFPRFTIRYALELLPFEAAGFKQADTEEGAVLLSDRVIVATQQTPGIRPWSHIPPGYEKPQQVDYNKAVGFLENGNQRFYHHGGGYGG